MNLRPVIYIIGAALLLCLAFIGGISLTSDRGIPDVLQNVTIGSLTALVGLLVPSDRRNP